MAVDLKSGKVDLVLRTLVVVGEATGRRAREKRARVDPHHSQGRAVPRSAQRDARRREDARLRERQRLEHRLVVLMLVLDDHLEHEAPSLEVRLRQHIERPLPHGREVLARRGCVEVLHLTANGARGLQCVVDVEEVGVHRLVVPDPRADPQLLERGDVSQVPGQGAHQLVVHPVEVGLRDGLHQPQRALARVLQEVGDLVPAQRLDPSEGRCFEMKLGHAGCGRLDRLVAGITRAFHRSTREGPRQLTR